MPSLPIEGWAVTHVAMDRSISSWAEPDEVFLLRRPRCWTLVTLAMASQPDGDESVVRARSSLSSEEFAFTEDLAEAVRARYYESGWLRLLDAGQDDPDLYRAWAPTRVERDFDRASLHNPDLTQEGAGRQVRGWHLSAVERMAQHLESDGFEITRLRLAVEVDDRGSANPVLGVVDVSRYGVDTPGVVRVDDAGEVYVRPPFDDPVEQWDLVDVGEDVRPDVVEPGPIEW